MVERGLKYKVLSIEDLELNFDLMIRSQETCHYCVRPQHENHILNRQLDRFLKAFLTVFYQTIFGFLGRSVYFTVVFLQQISSSLKY